MMWIEHLDVLENKSSKKRYFFKTAVWTWISANPLILNLSIYDKA